MTLLSVGLQRSHLLPRPWQLFECLSDQLNYRWLALALCDDLFAHTARHSSVRSVRRASTHTLLATRLKWWVRQRVARPRGIAPLCWASHLCCHSRLRLVIVHPALSGAASPPPSPPSRITGAQSGTSSFTMFCSQEVQVTTARQVESLRALLHVPGVVAQHDLDASLGIPDTLRIGWVTFADVYSTTTRSPLSVIMRTRFAQSATTFVPSAVPKTTQLADFTGAPGKWCSLHTCFAATLSVRIYTRTSRVGLAWVLWPQS